MTKAHNVAEDTLGQPGLRSVLKVSYKQRMSLPFWFAITTRRAENGFSHGRPNARMRRKPVPPVHPVLSSPAQPTRSPCRSMMVSHTYTNVYTPGIKTSKQILSSYYHCTDIKSPATHFMIHFTYFWRCYQWPDLEASYDNSLLSVQSSLRHKIRESVSSIPQRALWNIKTYKRSTLLALHLHRAFDFADTADKNNIRLFVYWHACLASNIHQLALELP